MKLTHKTENKVEKQKNEIKIQGDYSERVYYSLIGLLFLLDTAIGVILCMTFTEKINGYYKKEILIGYISLIVLTFLINKFRVNNLLMLSTHLICSLPLPLILAILSPDFLRPSVVRLFISLSLSISFMIILAICIPSLFKTYKKLQYICIWITCLSQTMLVFSSLSSEQIYDYFAELFMLCYIGKIWAQSSKFYTKENGANLQSILLTYTETIYYIPDIIFTAIINKINNKKKKNK